ncbi:RNUT1 [Babesia ovis]|uniref:Snurportin-1 n=1 Tax=Babesia ovis TaxID=5869 RepID=A0A9W5WUY2_BABOV|nr:RNUT1 [Babesia ovis]
MVEDSTHRRSAAKLRERLQGNRLINLGEVARDRRRLSLNELRRCVVESKRTAYIERLQVAINDVPEDSKVDMKPNENDIYTTEHDDRSTECSVTKERSANDLLDAGLFQSSYSLRHQMLRDIMSVLTIHEFLLATETEIREEAIALKNSLLFVRPEGHRVLITVHNYWGTEYCRGGYRRKSFKVPFTKGPTILDCIVNDGEYGTQIYQQSLKYYVVDVLLYNGCLMAPSDTECRTFFIRSRLEEAEAQYCSPSFVMLDYQECTPENMRDAYYGVRELGYERDSIVFVDRSASYVGGYNPNWLCWRDENTTKYIKVSKNGMIPARVVCECDTKLVKTLDGIVIGRQPEWLKLKQDRVLTVLIQKVNVVQLAVEEVCIPQDKNMFKWSSRFNGETADSLRKIVRRFILENQMDLDSEGSYNRLVDAVAAV